MIIRGESEGKEFVTDSDGPSLQTTAINPNKEITDVEKEAKAQAFLMHTNEEAREAVRPPTPPPEVIPQSEVHSVVMSKPILKTNLETENEEALKQEKRAAMAEKQAEKLAKDQAKTLMKLILKRGEDERQKRVSEIKTRIAQEPVVYRDVPVGARHFKSVVVPSAIHEKELAILEEQKGKYIPTLALREGSIGVISGNGFQRTKVTQIIDDSNMLCQIFDDTVWVTGNTAGLVDGNGVFLKGLYRCTGTKQYRTILGASRTIYQIEEFNP